MTDQRRGRGFDAALSREIDAWLRGDTSRREVVRGMLGLGGAAAASALFAPMVAQAAADLASPDTPVGQTQAAAIKASTEGPTDGSAYRATQAAKKIKGVTLNHAYEVRPPGPRAAQLLGTDVAGSDRGRVTTSSSCRTRTSIPSRLRSISRARAHTTSSKSSLPGFLPSPMAA